jgi:phosphate-selective porin
VGARYERLGFESAEQVGPAFRNPRAEHILGNGDSVWTVGVNWFPNRWVRVTLNGFREEIEDAPRTPVPGTTTFWSGLGRLQLVF